MARCGLNAGKITQSEFNQIKDRYLTNYKRLRQGCMPGEIRRHSDDSMWYDLNWRMSRDQWTPNVISLGICKQFRADMILGMAMRGFLFTTNLIPNYVKKGEPGYKIKLPDLTAFASWGFVLRWCPLFWPLLLVTDLDLLVNSILWYYRMKDPNNTNTDICNHLNALLQARFHSPTPVSWMARRMLDVDKVQDLLNRYYLPDGPALHLVAKDFLKEIW